MLCCDCCSTTEDTPPKIRTPFQTGGLSSAFLTRALRKGHAIDEDTSVASFEVKGLNGTDFEVSSRVSAVGSDQGQRSNASVQKLEIIRIILRYSRSEGYDRSAPSSNSAPRTIAAKFGSNTNYNEVYCATMHIYSCV